MQVESDKLRISLIPNNLSACGIIFRTTKRKNSHLKLTQKVIKMEVESTEIVNRNLSPEKYIQSLYGNVLKQ